MKKLLSLPPNLVHCFHELEGVDTSEWFCTSDPIGAKLGSGLPESPSRGGWKTKKEYCFTPVDKVAAFPDMLLPERY